MSILASDLQHSNYLKLLDVETGKVYSCIILA